MRRVLILLSLLIILVADARAQAPHEEWRTITTRSFRVHYPAAWEEWSVRAAERLESARERVAAVVGYDPDDLIEVVIMDPAATANGMALPVLGRPRIILWTTPPEPWSAIGDSRDWQEQLIVHETAHILHINRPSRNRLEKVLQFLVPIGPIASSPRWVSEGYATVIEGDLTGSGRPFRDYRAAVLRTWAETGRLPSYGQMASDDSSFMGMSMAYLAGSAYLEWLRDRTSPDSLQHLWRRMTARHDRDFDEAFRGVFGDSPQALYALFKAELTQKARNLRDEMSSGLREGELVLDLSRRAGPIDVSSDGSQLAGVVRERRKPARLVVWSTAIDEEAVTRRSEQLTRLIERDPDDVLPVDPPAAPRKRLHEHQLPAGADVESLAFMDDGRVLFTSSHPDDDGVLHSELHIWNPRRGNVRRLTHRGDLFSVAPRRGSDSAVAIRHRHGKSGVVTVELSTGAVTEITPPLLEPSIASVAVASDGRIALAERRIGSWVLTIADPEGRNERQFPVPTNAMITDLEWDTDGDSLLATIGRGGFLEISRLDTTTGEWRDLTRTTGASWSAAAGGDWVYFLALHPDGLDVRRIARLEEGSDPSTRRDDARYEPVVRRRQTDDPPPLLEIEADLTSRPYGLGPQEIDSVFGGYTSSEARLVEAGVRVGDLLGRFETLLMGGWSSDDERGILVDVRWRGTRSPLAATAWHWRRSEAAPEFTGVSVGANRTWRAIDRRFDTSGALGWQRMENAILSGSGVGAYVESSAAVRREFGPVRVNGGLSGRAEWMEAEDTDRVRGRAMLSAALTDWRLTYVDAVGVSSTADAFSVGGFASSVLPPFQRGALIETPALAPGRLTGERFRQQRVAASIPLIPGELFVERVRASTDLAVDQEVDLAGWNVRFGIPSIPLIGLPSLDLQMGVSHELDEPRARDLSWWIGTRWTLD